MNRGESLSKEEVDLLFPGARSKATLGWCYYLADSGQLCRDSGNIVDFEVDCDIRDEFNYRKYWVWDDSDWVEQFDPPLPSAVDLRHVLCHD